MLTTLPSPAGHISSTACPSRSVPHDGGGAPAREPTAALRRPRGPGAYGQEGGGAVWVHHAAPPGAVEHTAASGRRRSIAGSRNESSCRTPRTSESATSNQPSSSGTGTASGSEGRELGLVHVPGRKTGRDNRPDERMMQRRIRPRTRGSEPASGIMMALRGRIRRTFRRAPHDVRRAGNARHDACSESMQPGTSKSGRSGTVEVCGAPCRGARSGCDAGNSTGISQPWSTSSRMLR